MLKRSEGARDVRCKVLNPDNVARASRGIEDHKLRVGILRPTRRFESATVIRFNDGRAFRVGVGCDGEVDHSGLFVFKQWLPKRFAPHVVLSL